MKGEGRACLAVLPVEEGQEVTDRTRMVASVVHMLFSSRYAAFAGDAAALRIMGASGRMAVEKRMNDVNAHSGDEHRRKGEHKTHSE